MIEKTLKNVRKAFLDYFSSKELNRMDRFTSLALIATEEAILKGVLNSLTGVIKSSFNPLKDKLINEEGEAVMLTPPSGNEYPDLGFIHDISGYQAPSNDYFNTKIEISDKSDRLQLLKPFKSLSKEFINLRLLEEKFIIRSKKELPDEKEWEDTKLIFFIFLCF